MKAALGRSDEAWAEAFRAAREARRAAQRRERTRARQAAWVRSARRAVVRRAERRAEAAKAAVSARYDETTWRRERRAEVSNVLSAIAELASDALDDALVTLGLVGDEPEP